MTKLNNITGKRFGRLTAVSFCIINKRTQWLCTCDCGTTTTVNSYKLQTGITKSCGCLRQGPPKNRTHNMSKAPEYWVWNQLRDRCLNPNNHAFARYGGRGISVCDEWRNSFEAFFQDMGPRPSPTHTLERKNNHLGYSPDNCKWATWQEQSNNKSNNRLITFNGETRTLAGWGNYFHVSRGTIEWRIAHWGVDKALSRPFRQC